MTYEVELGSVNPVSLCDVFWIGVQDTRDRAIIVRIYLVITFQILPTFSPSMLPQQRAVRGLYDVMRATDCDVK